MSVHYRSMPYHSWSAFYYITLPCLTQLVEPIQFELAKGSGADRESENRYFSPSISIHRANKYSLGK